MAKIELRQDLLARLRGKNVLITGGANGIGRTTTLLLHGYGANVIIADVDVQRGESLIKEIGGLFEGCFQKTDVTDWHSLLASFKSAFEKYGSIDAVLANAALPERPPMLFDNAVDENGELKAPDFRLIDVNLNGVLRSILFQTHIWKLELTTAAAKLALHYFAKNPVPGGALVITGSAAS
ncbi:hypothetical protein CLAIMM_11756 [Cladophialophora immunda]|nr:hypothetical protein CLAIMM_11756 [Cladophialophora immunda]